MFEIVPKLVNNDILNCTKYLWICAYAKFSIVGRRLERVGIAFHLFFGVLCGLTIFYGLS